MADGCGGLGSRRYRELGDRTGAYLASRLIAGAVRDWACDHPHLPESPAQGGETLHSLGETLQTLLKGFTEKNGLTRDCGRIVGSMQRVLPSTLCAALTRQGQEGESCCFIWAGDSRGYGLDAQGLHQYTRDDLRAGCDPFEALYSDCPLSNCLSADQPIRLHLRRAALPTPGVLICATDGAFGCLPTPMEFEMLLLSTMMAAGDEAGWQRRLEMALHKLANDDATLLCRPRGFESFAAMKRFFAPRREELKRRFIVPVRQNGRDRVFARQCWQEYRPQYDRTEGGAYGQDDWCI